MCYPFFGGCEDPDYPAEADVRSGVKFDYGGKEGTLELAVLVHDGEYVYGLSGVKADIEVGDTKFRVIVGTRAELEVGWLD